MTEKHYYGQHRQHKKVYLFTGIHSFHMQTPHIYPNCLDKYAVFETLLPSRYIAGKAPSLLSAESGDRGDDTMVQCDGAMK